jgi:segregation and condensation protein A
VELEQTGWLHGPLRLRRIPEPGSMTQLPLSRLEVPATSPTRSVVAA